MSRKWVRLFQWRLHAKRVALRKCGLRDLHRCGPRSAERQMYRLCEHERRRPPIWRGHSRAACWHGGLDPRGSGLLQTVFFMFIRPQPYTCLGIEWLTQGESGGSFCVRFVFSPCELTVKGGWAGVKVTPASKEPGQARRAPARPAGRYGGERPHPRGGGRA